MTGITGRLAIQQRVLTPYRAEFFDFLARECGGGLAVCAGQPLRGEAVVVTEALSAARFHALRNQYIFSGPLLLYRQQGLQGWLGECDPQVLITEANPRNLSLAGGIHWMKKRGRPVLGWGLGAPAPGGGWAAGMEKGFLKRHLRQFDGLLTYSRRGAEEYAALGFPAERIFVAPNAATPRPRHPLPERVEASPEHPTVLFVGRLQARKRVDTLLQACASLPEARQPRVVIVGDGPERERLENLASQTYPAAEFVGEKHGPELAAYFSEADLFVLPGTGGLAVQEAMSYGLPIIMGEGDGTNDDLVRPENGWQVPVADSLGAVLGEALGDVPRLRRMGAASHRIVAEEINFETMAAVFSKAVNMIQKQ